MTPTTWLGLHLPVHDDRPCLADQPACVSLIPYPGLPHAALRQHGHVAQRVDSRCRQYLGVHGQADGGEPIGDRADVTRDHGLPAHLCQTSGRDLSDTRDLKRISCHTDKDKKTTLLSTSSENSTKDIKDHF